MSVRAPALPETLHWAREVMGATRDDVARAAGTTVSRVAQWEAGELSPTMNQLSKVARRLDRTTAFFFVPPPQDSGVPEVADFRAGRADGEFAGVVKKHLKRAETYRDFYLQLAGADDAVLPLRPFGWDEVELRATELREHLIDRYGGRPRDLKGWVAALEISGVLVFQATGVSLSAFRGVSIYHDRLPIILLNGADAERARVFSLFHELGHLCNRSSAMCLNLEQDAQEALCNRFSAELLAPRTEVLALLQSRPDSPVDVVASRFGISALAAAVRLHALGRIDSAAVERVRDESDRVWEAKRARDKASEGFVPQWRLRYRDLGPKYLSTVIEALEDSRINYLDASYMLNARVPMITKLQEELHSQGAL